MKRPTIRSLAIGLLLTITACAAEDQDLASAEQGVAGAGDLIANRYVVRFTSSVTDINARAAQIMAAHSGTVMFMYPGIRGFAGNFPDAQRAAVTAEAGVSSVEQDVYLEQTTTQSNAPWALDRIDQPTLPLSTTYSYTRTGAGVTVYVIDSGIRFSHTQFGGRASLAYDVSGGTGSDCLGHGTAVASVIGGSTYGVAKGVILKAVKTTRECSFGLHALTDVVAGLEWVRANHAPGAIVNMSLGGRKSPALDAAVVATINSGVAFAVAAGNLTDWDPLLWYTADSSPGNIDNVGLLAVGAIDSSDAFWQGGLWGSAIDILAPGVNVGCASGASDTAVMTGTGTSLASPQVAGFLALEREANPAASVQLLTRAVRTHRKVAVVTGEPQGTTDALLQTAWCTTCVINPLTVTVVAPATDDDRVAGLSILCNELGGEFCNAAYQSSETVTLTAMPGLRSRLKSWSGACTGSASTCTVSMSAAKSVTATFECYSTDPHRPC